MISVFRKHLQGRFLRYIIYIAAFLLLFPSAITVIAHWFDSGDWVIKVNGRGASPQELQRRIHEINDQIARFRKMFGQQAQMILAAQGLDKNPQAVAIDSLTVQKLIEGVAQDLHITLSPAYISQQLLAMVPKELIGPNGAIDLNYVAQMYGMTLSQLEEQVKNQLITQLIGNLTVGSLYLPEFIVKNKFTEDFAERNYRIATLPFKKILDQVKKTTLDDKEINAFFVKENKRNKRYWVSEKRSALMWTFNPDTYNAHVTDAQLNRYYTKNKYKEFIAEPAKIQLRRILLKFNDKTKAAVKVKVDQLRSELVKDPALFERKAREFSEDVTSKKNGGLLPLFSRGELDKPLDQAAFRLQKDGDISLVIENGNAYELLQRVSKKAQVFKELKSVKNEIKEKLAKAQFKQLFPHDIRRALAQEDKDAALATLAKKRNGKKTVITLAFQNSEPYMAKLFSLKKGGGGHLFDGEQGIALYVTDIQKAYQPKLAAVKSAVMNDIYKDRAHEKVADLLAEGEKLAGDKAAFEVFAKKNGASVESSGWVSQKSEQKMNSLRDKLGGEVGKIFVPTAHGSIIPFESKDGGFLVYLDSIKPFDAKVYEDHKSEMMAQIFNEQKMVVEQGFIASLLKNAKIKVNKKIVR